MQNNKLQDILLKFGGDPKRSVKHFIIGLLLFFAGMTLIYIALVSFIWLQIVGIAVMLVGLSFAGKGYLGIIANRLAMFRHTAYLNRQKYKDIE
jgi:hypothetical protein